MELKGRRLEVSGTRRAPAGGGGLVPDLLSALPEVFGLPRGEEGVRRGGRGEGGGGGPPACPPATACALAEQTGSNVRPLPPTPPPPGGARALRTEMAGGRFRVAWTLPPQANPDSLRAEVGHNGLLLVRVSNKNVLTLL